MINALFGYVKKASRLLSKNAEITHFQPDIVQESPNNIIYLKHGMRFAHKKLF